MVKGMSKTIQKDVRIDLRVETNRKERLLYAASLCNKKLSAFILDNADKAAEKIIADKLHFALPEKQWNAFCKALDAPARNIPKLKKLFTGPNIFNG